MAIYIPYPYIHLPARATAQKYTKKEKRAIALLSKVPAGGMFGEYIRNAVASGSRETLRKLICELKEQAAQAPRALGEAVGPEVMEFLLQEQDGEPVAIEEASTHRWVFIYIVAVVLASLVVSFSCDLTGSDKFRPVRSTRSRKPLPVGEPVQ